jgi:hypothetical protein
MRGIIYIWAVSKKRRKKRGENKSAHSPPNSLESLFWATFRARWTRDAGIMGCGSTVKPRSFKVAFFGGGGGCVKKKGKKKGKKKSVSGLYGL